MQSATLTRRGPGTIRLARLRAVRAGTWAKIGFAAMCVLALIGYFAFPTYPTYDSFYALLWGRDVLHLHLPDFRVYRGPTEHPLAIAFGAICSIFGQGGARLKYLACAAFAPLVWCAVDAAVTGNPLYSLTATAGLAQELERTQGLSSVVASIWTFGERIDKVPVILGALAGIPIAAWLAPRRAIVPLAALAALLGGFGAAGAGGGAGIA